MHDDVGGELQHPIYDPIKGVRSLLLLNHSLTQGPEPVRPAQRAALGSVRYILFRPYHNYERQPEQMNTLSISSPLSLC